MARKGKKNKKNKKKQRAKKNYNKKEFAEVFCQTCLICDGGKPTFCYSGLYQHEPKPFINKVFNNLVDIHAIYQSMGRPTKSMSIEQFQNVVCRTGICFNGDCYASATCEQLHICYKDFLKQMGVPNPGIIREIKLSGLIEFKNNKSSKRYISYSKKKKRKGKNRYVCTPYATFFSRDNADFQAEIKRILYGDIDSQQDKDQELSPTDTGAADRDTEGGEPKVHGSDSEG